MLRPKRQLRSDGASERARHGGGRRVCLFGGVVKKNVLRKWDPDFHIIRERSFELLMKKNYTSFAFARSYGGGSC